MTSDLSADGHIHTYLCRHAIGSMEDYVQAALARGLCRITFLEHLEAGIDYAPRTWLTDEDFDYYFSEGARLRSFYGSRLQIELGVEVGYNPDCPKILLQLLSARSWDRIGLSYHFHRFPDASQHLNLLSHQQKNLEAMRRYGSDKLLGQYFDILLEAVLTIPADVLCHLDAGLRHYPGRKLTDSHHRQIDRLLEAVQQRGMALEINTSGYDLGGAPFPPLAIIRQAREMGIDLILGSDAHQPADVGRHFNRLAAELNQAPRS